jgi:hypothetical protein
MKFIFITVLLYGRCIISNFNVQVFMAILYFIDMQGNIADKIIPSYVATSHLRLTNLTK